MPKEKNEMIDIVWITGFELNLLNWYTCLHVYGLLKIPLFCTYACQSEKKTLKEGEKF